ncbi:MAG: nitrilase-related carbon-nitrogen hydrolase, partial [Sciscionella sp.]
FCGAALRGLAEKLDGPWACAVQEIAARHGVVLVAGMFTPAPDGRVHNTVLVTGNSMHLGYDKIHLYDAFGFAESRTVAPGEDLLTVAVDDLTLGIATCYDVRFPALFHALADRGAQAIALPASWGAGAGKREQWELLLRARALDCTSWVLACGQADPRTLGRTPSGKAPTGLGYSAVSDPQGRITASLQSEPDVLVTDIDTALVDSTRATIPVLANRRNFPAVTGV